MHARNARFTVVVAVLAIVSLSAEAGAAANDHYFKSSKALEGKWYSGGTVTSTRNVSVGSFDAANVCACVGSFTAGSE